MRALIHEKYGTAEVLELREVEKPTPKANEVLVKVYAATVNRTDCANLKGKPFIMQLMLGIGKPKNQFSGTDFAGTIETVGNNVSKFKKGEKVFGFDDGILNSHAEYLVISEKNAFAAIPEGISFQQAAASIEGAHYGYNMINKVKLKAGKNALVNGASGAIGSAVVQLLRYYGIEVTAVCNSKSMEKVKTLSPDKIVNFEKEDFTQLDEKFSFVFDAVGKSSFSKCKPVMDSGGVYISSELGKNTQNIFYSLFTPILGKKKVKFPFPFDRLRSVHLIKDLLKEGKFEPLIDSAYSLDKAADAFEYVFAGNKIGNVVLNINAS